MGDQHITCNNKNININNNNYNNNNNNNNNNLFKDGKSSSVKQIKTTNGKKCWKKKVLSVCQKTFRFFVQ